MTYSQVWDHTANAPSQNIIVRDEDQAFIPNDPDNVDYQDYLAWLAKGNEPNPPPATPAPPIEEPPPPDINEVHAQVQDIDARLTALETDLGR
jgi:hypothetical protein